jgi:hypothetical protein
MGKETIQEAFAKRKAQEKRKEETILPISNEVRELFVKRFGKDKIAEAETQASGRKLIFIKVDDSLAILRPPTAEDLGQYLMAIAENGMAKAGVEIVDKLWIDGDVELLNDEDKWCAVFLKINSVLEGKKGEFFRG